MRVWLVLLPFLFSLVSCSSFRKKASIPTPTPQVEGTTTSTPTPATAPTAAMPTATHSAAQAKPAAEAPQGVDPEKALTWLKHGNSRFLKGYTRRDGQSRKDIARLEAGQKPHAIVLACSDSRVPPELVFDQKLGEIFTVRTAGESVDKNVVASIEYAIAHLGPRLIVVMGHTQCGAVRAAMNTMKGGDAGSPDLNALMGELHPRLKEFRDHEASKDLAPESMANVKGVMANLTQRSAIIRKAVESGEVVIKSALYHLDSGEVTFE